MAARSMSNILNKKSPLSSMTVYQERIESLKVAAELSGQNFDEKEFIADCRNFAEEDNEEFNIDY